MDQNEEKGLERLQIWQKAMNFAVSICKEVLPSLPSVEKYALVDQLRRSAQSIPANIAEGHGRYYYQESVRYCYLARGSLAEVYSHLCFANRMNYVSDDMFRKYTKDIQEIHRMLNGYIAFLRRTKQGDGELNHSIRETPHPYTFEADDPLIDQATIELVD